MSSAITEARLVEFQSKQPTTYSGRLIVVQSIWMTSSKFAEMLADEHHLSAMMPDIVVLNSPQQANQVASIIREARNMQNACGEKANCPTFIPNWVAGERLDASQRVFSALVSGD